MIGSSSSETRLSSTAAPPAPRPVVASCDCVARSDRSRRADYGKAQHRSALPGALFWNPFLVRACVPFVYRVPVIVSPVQNTTLAIPACTLTLR